MFPLKYFFVLSSLWIAVSWAGPKSPVSLDFVDAPLADVVRSVSVAYEMPILVDDGADERVTFHLDGLGVLEGISALCGAHGLELVQEGGVFHVRRMAQRGLQEFSRRDSLVSIQVKNQNVADFILEFGLNVGLNILGSPNLSGQVSGTLRDVLPEDALKLLMKANGFVLHQENSSKGRVFRVENRRPGQGDSLASGDVPPGKLRLQREGDLYSVESNDASLGTVLQEVSREAELGLALYGNIQESVRLRLELVTLEKLLDALFRGRRYSYALEDSILFVAESGSRNAISATRRYPLKHIHPELALGYLAKLPPSANFIAAEVKEQNCLLLSGSVAEIQMAEDLLKQVDVPALQVTLSCIIVEFKRGRAFEIGLHSGGSRKTAEKDVGLRGFLDFSNANLTRSGAFGKIGLLPDRFEMELASLEENNAAEVLARPRLTTINGNKAELNVTNTVYYLVSQVSADGFPITDYRSFNDGISLEITPSVTQDGNITLEVSPEIKTAGRSSGDGPRDISTRNLKTVVVLRNGETLCLGGLIRKTKSEVRSAVPFLGSLPLIGRLFSYVSEEEENNELAIFITPHVENSIEAAP